MTEPRTGQRYEPNAGDPDASAPDAGGARPPTSATMPSTVPAARFVGLRTDASARPAGTRRSAPTMVGGDRWDLQLATSHPTPLSLRREGHSDVSIRCPRSWWTAFVWIWQTRDSVTPRISPISARVIPSK